MAAYQVGAAKGDMTACRYSKLLLLQNLCYLPAQLACPAKGVLYMKFAVLQERSPVSMAAAAPSANPLYGVPYGKGCTVDRSASMDSDISSFSPVPKRHCFGPSEAPINSGSAQFDYHYAQQQQQQDFCLQQHASIPAATLADAQKAYALKLMLSQKPPEEAAALVAFLRRFQRLEHAATSQPSQAQPQCPTLQSTGSQPVAQYSSNRLPPSTILRLQAAYGQVVQASQHQQQHTGDTLPQHMIAGSRQTSIDAFMTQLREIQTPAQYGEGSSSMVAGPAAAAVWYDNPAVPAEPSTAAYEPVQPQIHAQWSAYCQEHKPSQPDFAWQVATAASCTQAAATGCEADTSHSPAAFARCLLYKQGQLKMALLQYQQRQQQHLMASAARKQQAFLERQAALSPMRPVSSPIRPALGFPELLAYWAKGLGLQRCESVYLACHLWTKVQQQVSYYSPVMFVLLM